MKLLMLGLAVVGGAAWLGASKMPTGETEIARYETSLKGRTPNQRHNAMLSAREIDGVEIGPGSEFSFNGRLKGWTAKDGYRKAPVSYNGTLIDSFGGGVCQTSSTLYNAALLAGCEIIQRHSHQFQPGYVPPGRDAAVAYENIDLRFKNTMPGPMKIKARVQSDRLIITLSSNQPLNDRPQLQSEVMNRVAPQTFRYGSGPHLFIRNTGKPGYEVRVWRIWKDRREVISTKTYPVMHRVVELRK